MSHIRLTDRQCKLFLRDIREFGYPDVTFDDVRVQADRIADGKDVSDNVIGVILRKQIDEAMIAKGLQV